MATAAETLVRDHDGHPVPASGSYEIDPSHTTVEFVARHLMISKVRGRFTGVSGVVDIAERPEDSSVEVAIDASSVQTDDERRDGHLRSPDFFDVERYPTLTFRSAGVEPRPDGTWKVAGELTVREATPPVDLDVEFEGAGADPWGQERIGFSAAADVDREEWGLTWNQALEAGGVLVGRKVRIELAVEAVRR
jgi:polyisoprenoid-binding protein YceI